MEQPKLKNLEDSVELLLVSLNLIIFFEHSIFDTKLYKRLYIAIFCVNTLYKKCKNLTKFQLPYCAH